MQPARRYRGPMAARAIGTGNDSFGLVSIPIRGLSSSQSKIEVEAITAPTEAAPTADVKRATSQ